MERRQLYRELYDAFSWLARQHVTLIVQEDAFGLVRGSFLVNESWRNLSDDEKLERYQEWLKGKIEDGILSRKRNYARAIENAYRKGLLRAFNKVNIENVLNSDLLDDTTKEKFVRGLINGVGRTQLGLMVGQFVADVNALTASMASRIGKKIVEGFLKGWKPKTLKNAVNKLILNHLEKKAAGLAHDAIVRAQAEGQLDALENLGIKEVEPEVEFVDAGDEKVCPVCKSYNGQRFTISEARGIIPVHYWCRCGWIPVLR